MGKQITLVEDNMHRRITVSTHPYAHRLRGTASMAPCTRLRVAPGLKGALEAYAQARPHVAKQTNRNVGITNIYPTKSIKLDIYALIAYAMASSIDVSHIS